MAEKITDYDSKSLEELSVPILKKEEFERKQIEEMQEEICEKAHELWKDTLNNIDGLVLCQDLVQIKMRSSAC